MENNSNLIEKELRKRKDAIRYLNLQLASLGQPLYEDTEETNFCNPKFQELAHGLIKRMQESSRLLSGHLAPVDLRIQEFVNSYLKDIDPNGSFHLPNNTLVLTKAGHAREVSLPPNGNTFVSENVSSYRIKQGILNNPIHDKRTTKGTFHIVEGDLPVPLDKFEVPKITFKHFLKAALNPSDELKTLPFTSKQPDQAKVMVSMLMRPVVCPEVKGVLPKKSMEVRFFAPGSLVSNLDFVESIFGNAGDPNLAQNDAALDTEHWTGHTGCIILAPQLKELKKKDIGLPHFDQATDRQRKDGMCWKNENDLYNDGGAFKVTCRDDRGVVVTLIADNYFGYSKKEIKTQISYAANLYGILEEEHAGGAIAFPRAVMGPYVDGTTILEKHLNSTYNFEEAKSILGDRIEVKPENYAVDKKYPNIVYIPEFAEIDIERNSIHWMHNGVEQKLVLSPDKTYVHPTGNKFNLEKHKSIALWRILMTAAEGVFCHKPCTVSGGGKSEISKSMQNAITYNTFNIQDIEADFKKADEIIEMDFSKRWKNYIPGLEPSRPFLSPKRTLGSAVKLLTPSDENSDEFNAFLNKIPVHIRSLVLFVKRLYRHDHDELNWKEYMSVEIVNGKKGTMLQHKTNPVVGSYVRIGFTENGTWMTHKLRSDFSPSAKIQTEDDITASVTLPQSSFKNLNSEYTNKSLKVATNCEAHLFQRPDEAIIRGYDKEAERDLVSPDTYLTNYEPLRKADALAIVEDTIQFDKYTQPVKDFIHSIIESEEEDIYFSLPSHTRIVDGEPTKNPRYLQRNIEIDETEGSYLAEMGVRLFRKINSEDPVVHVINAVLPGRRNNPVDKAAGIRPLAVYNPIHYQETPELFMDFICSLTGKSPSTTGAGTEGALTKGPFNMLTPTTDLNNALLSHILTESNAFSTAAGYVGAEYKVDHDISLLIPEIWARLLPEDRDPKFLIEKGCLEKLEDFEYKGKKVLASRLGYRITKNFTVRCMNRIFDEPAAVFSEKMLKPELQGMDDYVDGIFNIMEAQEKVAKLYFEDGSIDAAIPPLQILIHMMAYGHYNGKEMSDPELRATFDREAIINSDWYKERLKLKQAKDLKFYEKQISYLEKFIAEPSNESIVAELNIPDQLEKAKEMHAKVGTAAYLESLVGTIGADPLFRK